MNHLSLKTAQSSQENGKGRTATGMECKFGLMAPNTTGSGSRTRPMGTASFIMPRVMSMTASGKMTRLRVTVFTSMRMDQGMRDTGETISSMAKAQSSGPMVPSMQDFTKTG